MANEKGRALDWDEMIESDGKPFVILSEGDYQFKVNSFERGRFPGSDKMEACNKIILDLSVDTPEGDVSVKTDLILNSLMEWQLSAFFRSIGQKKHGEKVRMNWNEVSGAMGRAHFKPRTFKGTDGTDKQANNVAYFIDYDESKMSLPKSAAEKEFPF